MKNTIFVLAFLAASTCMAATKITYDEIPKHLGRFGRVLRHRGFTVITSDGKTHTGRRLLLESDHLRIFHRHSSFEDLPSFEVTQIEVRQAGRFFHHVVDNADLAPLCPLAAAIGALSLAAADGIALFVPPRVYEIVH
jgi:hypothetical protein